MRNSKGRNSCQQRQTGSATPVILMTCCVPHWQCRLVRPIRRGRVRLRHCFQRSPILLTETTTQHGDEHRLVKCLSPNYDDLFIFQKANVQTPHHSVGLLLSVLTGLCCQVSQVTAMCFQTHIKTQHTTQRLCRVSSYLKRLWQGRPCGQSRKTPRTT